MTSPTQNSNAGAPASRTPVIIGVVALAVIAGLVLTFFLTREPEFAAGGPTPSASPTPSAPASPSGDPSPSEEPSPEPTPVAAPEDWTQVHTIGDGSTRMVAGEIAWGDAGFLAIGRRWEGGEGGPRVTAHSMWRSADGQSWAEVPYPVPDEGEYDVAALSGAADGSYVFHAFHFNPDVVASPIVSLRSTDGETWEPLETGLSPDLYIQAIEEGPAGYLLVGGQGGDTNPTLWLSSDALTWELVHEFSQDEQFVQLHDGDGGAEGYVVIGRRIDPDTSVYQRFAFASADGREWVEQTEPFGPDDQEFQFEVAVSSREGNWLSTLGQRDETTSLWASDEGLTWSQTGSLDARNESANSAGLFEEVGSELILAPGASVSFSGTQGAWSSTDGTTWSPVDLGADAWVGDIAIGEGVVAMTGTIPDPAGEGTSTGVIWIRASD